ncbi:MAG: hypothetical protein AAF587_20755 [Bacteroidota bacterium]
MKDLQNLTNPTFPGVLFSTNDPTSNNNTDPGSGNGNGKVIDPSTTPGTEVADEDDE